AAAPELQCPAVPRLCRAWHAHCDLRADHLPARPPTRPEPGQPLPARRAGRYRPGAVDPQRIAEHAGEHADLLSPAQLAGMSTSLREQTHLWQAPALGDVEMLHARYFQQRFAPHVHEGYVFTVI